MQIAIQLAKWIQKIQPDDIPKIAKEKAKMSVLDTIGVTLIGATDDVGRIIHQYVESIGGKPDCWLIGTSIRTSPPLAAMANGAMGHALDFDDTNYSYVGHPSVSVLPAALAIGEATGASGDQVLSAYIIGTEVVCKLGAMTTPKLFEDGWHATSVIGAFGATAAATKLLGLNTEQIVHAFGITVSQISGILGNNGTMSKPFQVGRSAENGVVAALLAQMGMTGSHDIFEKTFGFGHTFKVNHDFGPFYATMGRPFDIDRPGFFLKEFPSCSATHPALNAVIKLIREHQFTPYQVKSVDCATTPFVVNFLAYNNPQNVVEARFSMQYCLATALLNAGKLTIDDFRDEKVRDPQVRKMMQKISLRVSSKFKKKGFVPSEGPEAANIVIALKGGKLLRAEKTFPDWNPDAMPSWDALSSKFKDCASAILSKDKLEQSIERIQRLEIVKDIRTLMASIVV